MTLYTVGASQGLTMTAASYNRFNNCFLLDCLLAVAFKIASIIVICKWEDPADVQPLC